MTFFGGIAPLRARKTDPYSWRSNSPVSSFGISNPSGKFFKNMFFGSDPVLSGRPSRLAGDSSAEVVGVKDNLTPKTTQNTKKPITATPPRNFLVGINFTNGSETTELLRSPSRYAPS